MWAFLNGEFVKEKGDNIRLENRGLTFADGLFEVVRTIEGQVVFFQEHFSRLEKSAKFFDISLPWTGESVKRAALELIDKNDVRDGELYIELTRGNDKHREHRYPEGNTSTFFMLALPLRHIEKSNWETGVEVFTYPDLRHKLCEHKTINLLPNVLAKNYAYSKGGYEALMFTQESGIKYASEGGSSNYFLFKDGLFHTPEIDNVLPGITRGKVIPLIEGLGYDVHQRKVEVEEFFCADEVFLVSTVSRVMPVRTIDGIALKCPGEHTVQVKAAYEELFFSQIKKETQRAAQRSK